jgi:hypothetical protein
MGNIALNKTATASSSIMPYAPSRAVDGGTEPSKRWVCNSLPAWLAVDPGAAYLVNRWVVKHPPLVGWQQTNYVNMDFKLQGSNNQTSWVDIDTVSGNQSSMTDRMIQPVVYRFYRLYVNQGLRCNPQTASVLELELYQDYSAQLTNIAISAGTLSPAFNPGILAYTATVGPEASSINVVPTSLSPTAVITVNGKAVVSGGPAAVALSFGSNTITVNVTDATQVQNYTITVNRQGSLLSSLTVQTEAGANIPLTPSFASETANYNGSVDSKTVKVTFTPTAQNSRATITINGEAVANGVVSKGFDVEVGSNQIPIVVTADGNSFTYNVTIIRAQEEVSLLLDHVVFDYTGRGLTPGSKTITMIDTQTDYPVNIPTPYTSVTVTPFARNNTVIILVNNESQRSGEASRPIGLPPTGNITITIIVRSPDGTLSHNYTFDVWKVSI